MRIILTVFLVIVSLFIVQPALASTDICYLGSQAAHMTQDQIDDFYERQIEGQLLTGRGEVKRIVSTSGEGLDGKYEVEIACSPTVVVTLQTNGFGIERAGAKKGVVVSFSGECFQIYKSGDVVHCVVKATIR